MRLFFKAEKSDLEKSAELAARLKTINPKANEKEIEKVNEKILATHEEFERNLKLRESDRTYRLRFDIEKLYGVKQDLELAPWRERNSIIGELTELTRDVVDHSLNWLIREGAELEKLKDIQEVSKKQDAGTLQTKFTVKTNFGKISEAQDIITAAKKKIRSMAGSASIGSIEAIYLKSIEDLPTGKVPCTEQVELDEQEYFDLKETLSTGMMKSDADILVTYQRYGIH